MRTEFASLAIWSEDAPRAVQTYAPRACLATSVTAMADATNAQTTCLTVTVAITQPHVSPVTAESPPSSMVVVAIATP